MSYAQIDYSQLSNSRKKSLWQSHSVSSAKSELHNSLKRNKNVVGKYFEEKLNKRPTKAEEVFKKMLDECGVKYRQNMRFFSERTLYLVDFYVLQSPNGNFGFEVDGGYHKERKAYDRQRDEFLRRKHRVTIIRFTNEEVFNSIAKVREKVTRTLFEIKD